MFVGLDLVWIFNVGGRPVRAFLTAMAGLSARGRTASSTVLLRVGFVIVFTIVAIVLGRRRPEPADVV